MCSDSRRYEGPEAPAGSDELKRVCECRGKGCLLGSGALGCIPEAE